METKGGGTAEEIIGCGRHVDVKTLLLHINKQAILNPCAKPLSFFHPEY